MATVTTRPPVYDHDENQRRVRHPLSLLRKYIRTYVVLEGCAIALLFLAAWFWIGLALDYGLFKLFAFDWVQELRDVDPQVRTGVWVRLVILVTLSLVLVGLVLTKVVRRYLRDFTDATLALVLERRFPRELGDRLITAVEIADPALAVRYGFSRQMVEKTVTDCIERLERLPVAEVFNWARLRRLWLLVAASTVGVYLLVGLATCGLDLVRSRFSTNEAGEEIPTASMSPLEFVWRFQDVANTWVERNLLLQDSFWPRRSYLEVLRFKPTQQDAQEMRMGQKQIGLQVRAYEWVVADRAAGDGWRPLLWSDLPRFVDADVLNQVDVPAAWPYWLVDLADLDPRVPADLVPAQWQGLTTGEARKGLADPILRAKIANAGARDAVEALLSWRQWPVDKIQLQMKKPAVRAELIATTALADLEKVFAQLAEQADSPLQSRQLRRLEIPQVVEVYYRGKSTKNRAPCPLIDDNKFAVGLNDLKESVRFRVRGEDYYTPSKKITLVPPPSISELSVDKEEPAYLYVRLQGDDQSLLRGRRQLISDYTISTTGELSTVDVPVGGTVTLRARADRPLRAPVFIKTPDKDDPKKLNDTPFVATMADAKTFTVAFGEITRPLDLTFEFTDDDNIVGQRRILFQPGLDQPPDISDFDLDVVLRKPRFKADGARGGAGGLVEGYLITPEALLPFKGTVADDHGLARVGWQHEARQVDLELIGAGRDKNRLPTLVLQGSAVQRRMGLVASALRFPPFGVGQLMAPSYLAWVGQTLQFDLAQSAGQGEIFTVMDEFQRMQERKGAQDVPAARLDDVLRGRKSATRLTPWSFQLTDEPGFDLKRQQPKLKTADAKEGQLHYQLRVSVLGIDNNVDTGTIQRDDQGRTTRGNATRSKTFFFLVVSENELLAQIAIEEEVLFERLEKVLDKVKAAMTTTDDQIRKLNAGEKELGLIAIRMDETRKAIMDAGSITREVTTDYGRILKEMQVNRVARDKVTKVEDKIVIPLERIVSPNLGTVATTEDAVQRAYEVLDSDASANRLTNAKQHLANLDQARGQLRSLHDQINDVMINMSEGIAESKLLEILINAERTQRTTTQTLRVIHNEEVRKIFEGILDQPKK